MTFSAAQADRDLLTRRALLKGAGTAAGVALLGGGVAGAARLLEGSGLRQLRAYAPPPKGVTREFVSRPDLRPPAAVVTGRGAAPGYLFLGPSAYGLVQSGSLLLDRDGEPAWFLPATHERWVADFKLQSYRGQPVLTWWEGQWTDSGFGQGEAVIMDSSYREIARVRAGNGHQIDLHEFILTPQGTAMFTCCPVHTSADLSALGGPKNGTALESVIQEVDVQSGRVLFEWRSLDHIPVTDSYLPFKDGYDYLHLNSIDIMPDGNLLISARHTWAVYKLDRRTGGVIWRLGGKSSDFNQDQETRFAWQHDARQPRPGVITLFDDGAAQLINNAGEEDTEPQSRGVALDIDEGGRKVSVQQIYLHPKPLLTKSMGNLQTLANGHVLVGWGDLGFASEYTPDGEWVSDTRFGNRHDSYRAYKFDWHGTPLDAPALAARRTGAGATTLYMSWNGATAVTHWIVSVGRRVSELRPIGITGRQGFETAVPLPSSVGGGYAKVTAVDGSGRSLKSSRVVRV